MCQYKFDEIIGAIDVKSMNKLMRVEQTNFRNQNFNQRVIRYAGGATLFAGHVSSDEHLWFVPKDNVL